MLSQLGADFAVKPFGLVLSARGNGLQMEAISTGKADWGAPRAGQRVGLSRL